MQISKTPQPNVLDLPMTMPLCREVLTRLILVMSFIFVIVVYVYNSGSDLNSGFGSFCLVFLRLITFPAAKNNSD